MPGGRDLVLVGVGAAAGVEEGVVEEVAVAREYGFVDEQEQPLQWRAVRLRRARVVGRVQVVQDRGGGGGGDARVRGVEQGAEVGLGLDVGRREDGRFVQVVARHDADVGRVLARSQELPGRLRRECAVDDGPVGELSVGGVGDLVRVGLNDGGRVLSTRLCDVVDLQKPQEVLGRLLFEVRLSRSLGRKGR